MAKKLKVEVKESADYDNYLGEVKDESLATSLGSFMEDGEDGINEEADIEQWRKHWAEQRRGHQKRLERLHKEARHGKMR